VGGGLAAQRACETLRKRGYDGRIQIVCAERHRPYDRPPLSKGALAAPGVDVSLRPADWYTDNGVELLLGARGVHVSRSFLELADGSSLAFDQLLIATGASARRLPVVPWGQTLRTLDDAVRLREGLTPGARLAIVGAGFVGQEVASTARSLGAEVTLIDAAPLPLAGVVGAEWARWLMDVHRSEGVDVVLGDGIADSEPGWIELVSGRRVACDHVLVGIGVVPNDELLHGLRYPNVFAAGDCVAGTEHWEAATRQAQAAACAMLKVDCPAPAPHAFWTDQFGMRIQFVGETAGPRTGSDPITAEVDGDPAARSFHVVYRQGGREVAALLVNRPRLLPQYRRAIAAHPEEVL
jgi:NADPH-dependent 2,4-dienoyl-CoA reductase/sulfur reductase-like enzyme